MYGVAAQGFYGEGLAFQGFEAFGLVQDYVDFVVDFNSYFTLVTFIRKLSNGHLRRHVPPLLPPILHPRNPIPSLKHPLLSTSYQLLKHLLHRLLTIHLYHHFIARRHIRYID